MDLLDLFISYFYLFLHSDDVSSAGHMCSTNIYTVYIFSFVDCSNTVECFLPFICLIHDLFMYIIAKSMFRFNTEKRVFGCEQGSPTER